MDVKSAFKHLVRCQTQCLNALCCLVVDVVDDALTATVVSGDLQAYDDETDFCHLVSWLLERSLGKVHSGLHVHLEILRIKEVDPAGAAVAVVLHWNAAKRR